MKLVIYSDIHKGAPHETKFDLFQALEVEDAYFTGDIYDLKNTEKSKLKHYENEFKEFKKKAGARYILGNHECMKPDEYYVKRDHVLLCHGHTLVYSEDKVKRWENKKIGKSKLRYWIYRLKHLGKKIVSKEYKPSEELKEKCYNLCKAYECNTIVFGHTHRHCDIKFKGIRIINVPRGRTIIDV